MADDTRYFVDDQFIKEFRLMKQWIRNFSVSGAATFKNNPGLGMASLCVNPRRAGRAGGTPDDPPLVKVGAAASGGGKYTGNLWTPATAAIFLTGNLTEAELGVVGDAIYILNAAEVGQSTHALTAGTPVAKIFPAVLLPAVASDGKAVYFINGYDREICTS